MATSAPPHLMDCSEYQIFSAKHGGADYQHAAVHSAQAEREQGLPIRHRLASDRNMLWVPRVLSAEILTATLTAKTMEMAENSGPRRTA